MKTTDIAAKDLLLLWIQSSEEKPAGRNLEISGALSPLQGETSVPGCRLETDLQNKAHLIIHVSRMLAQFAKTTMPTSSRLSSVPFLGTVHVVQRDDRVHIVAP